MVHPDKLQSRLATQAFNKLSQAVNELVQTHVARGAPARIIAPCTDHGYAYVACGPLPTHVACIPISIQINDCDTELTHHDRNGSGVHEDELSVDPAYAWWTEWFPTGPAPEAGAAEQRTAADAAQQDAEYLSELPDDDLQVEAAARQDAVMRALGGVGQAAEASERLKRVRVEVTTRGTNAGVSLGSTDAMDEAREFAAGGFF